MSTWRNIFSLLCILFAFQVWAADEAVEDEKGQCAEYLEALAKRQATSPIYLQSRLEELRKVPSAKLAELVNEYDDAIASLTHEIEMLKGLYKSEFGWRSYTTSMFSGERLLIDNAIVEMERNLRDLKRERTQAYRLIPGNSVLNRVIRAVREYKRKPAKPVVAREVEPEPSNLSPAEQWFLSPLNPAGPNFGRTQAEVEEKE